MRGNSRRDSIRSSDVVGHSVLLPVLRLHVAIGLAVADKHFLVSVILQFPAADTIRNISQVDENCALMSLFDIRIGILAAADAVDKIRLMPFVREIAFVLRNKLSA